MLQSFLCSLPLGSPGAPQPPRDWEVAVCMVKIVVEEDTGWQALRPSLSCCISLPVLSGLPFRGLLNLCLFKPLWVRFLLPPAKHTPNRYSL